MPGLLRNRDRNICTSASDKARLGEINVEIQIKKVKIQPEYLIKNHKMYCINV